jgi:hypothetical protein
MKFYYFYTIKSVESLNIYKELIEKNELDLFINCNSLEEIEIECKNNGKQINDYIPSEIKRLPAFIVIENNKTMNIFYSETRMPNNEIITLKKAIQEIFKSKIKRKPKEIQIEKGFEHVNIKPIFKPQKQNVNIIESRKLEALKNSEHNSNIGKKTNFSNFLAEYAKKNCLRDEKGIVKQLDPKSKIID